MCLCKYGNRLHYPGKISLVLEEVWCVLLLKGLFTRNQEQDWGLQEGCSGQNFTLSLRELAWVWLGLTHSEPQETLSATHGFVPRLKNPSCGKCPEFWLPLGQKHTSLSEKGKTFPEGSEHSYFHVEMDSHGGLWLRLRPIPFSHGLRESGSLGSS